MHFFTAVGGYDKSFADSFITYEKRENVIENVSFMPTLQQLSATL